MLAINAGRLLSIKATSLLKFASKYMISVYCKEEFFR